MARFRGTGMDERGRYPAGVVVDVDPPEDAEGLVERGHIEPLEPAEDPGRSQAWQLADAAVRGDLFTHPDDRAAAVAAGLIEEHEGGYSASPTAATSSKS